MIDIIGRIKEKSGIDGDALTVPQSVQEVLQIKAVFPDGIFMVGKELFSKMFQFTDINYAVSSRKDKEDEFFKYSEMLNSLENGVSSQITIINRKINDSELNNIMLTENAQVIGDIKTGTLAMSRGAKVSGKVDMGH